MRSLADKKFRLKYNCFVAEGNKIAVEILNSNWAVEQVFATNDFVEKNIFKFDKNKITIASTVEIERLSQLSTPTNAIVVAKMPPKNLPDFNLQNWSLALDNIQDPGNLGSIIRTADWFGISQIFLSAECADVFNPKTIQSSMGSFLRVQTISMDLEELLNQNKFAQTCAAVMVGQNIFTTTFEKSGLMILGNEGKGVSKNLLEKINLPITILGKGNAESLNVAVAAGIICSVVAKVGMM